MSMRNREFTNFGELYRAAFAEPDLQKKEMLLAQVKLAIDAWQKMSEEPLHADENKRPTHVSSESSLSWRQIA